MNQLREWGYKVWVHTTEGTKLDGRSKIGKWVGFDEMSNGHRIYWPDKCSITVERSVKFDNSNGDMIILPIPTAMLIQGENEPRNQQRTLKVKSEELPEEPKKNTPQPKTLKPSKLMIKLSKISTPPLPKLLYTKFR